MDFYIRPHQSAGQGRERGQFAPLAFPREMGDPSPLLPAADYPPMNFTQMHDYLRLELNRRIQRGTVSVSLLARQTGLGQSHLSNFMHSRRQLSLDAIDRVLAAQHLTAADLLPALAQIGVLPDLEENDMIPIVSHAAALFEPFIRPPAI